jgi:putative hydrolase of the HAD superfamily/pyrimidine and pyridine-specific 5'-nucleotidase
MRLYLEHGTTMAGLVAAGHTLDFEHYHARVHGSLDYAALLHANGVRDVLMGMTGVRKHIFTNADAAHTAECLARLEIEDCFEVGGGGWRVFGGAAQD